MCFECGGTCDECGDWSTSVVIDCEGLAWLYCDEHMAALLERTAMMKRTASLN